MFACKTTLCDVDACTNFLKFQKKNLSRNAMHKNYSDVIEAMNFLNLNLLNLMAM